MRYVYVVTVGLKEVRRVLSPQVAAEVLVTECKKLIDREGMSPSVRDSCWIEGYLVDDASAQAALSPDYDINRHRWAIDQFDNVIANAHSKGWMQGGEWVAQAV
jgi:hypothetical protein